MKISIAILPFALSFLSFTSAVTLSYDPVYDNAAGSLSSVACSDGPHGLLTRGYTTFGSLPSFPYIGAAAPIGEWNSPNCGACYELTYTNVTTGIKTSVNVLAIDRTVDGFNIALAAMNKLTGGHALQLGRVDVITKLVNASGCNF